MQRMQQRSAVQHGGHGSVPGTLELLLRCRRLGSALGDFIRVTFEAQGRETGYGPPDDAYAGHAVNARV